MSAECQKCLASPCRCAWATAVIEAKKQSELAQASGSVCEFKFSKWAPSDRTDGRGRKKEIFVPCGKPAAYRWTPRGRPMGECFVCKDCAAIAGNFTDELTPVTQNEGGQP